MTPALPAELAHGLRALALERGASHCGIADLRPVHRVWPQSFIAYGELLTGIALLVPENHDLLDRLPTTDDRSRTSHYNIKIALGLAIAGEIRDRLTALGHRAAVLNHPPRPPEKPTGLLKAAARLAGLGWIGRNRLLITPDLGPRVAPALVLTDAPLPPTASAPMPDGCRSCTRCVRICPAMAFTSTAFGELDSLDGFATGRCAQVRGTINPTGWGACSLCVQICPYGSRAQGSADASPALPLPMDSEAPA